MNINERIEAFTKLGDFLKQFRYLEAQKKTNLLNTEFYTDFQQLIRQVSLENIWFTPENIRSALKGMSFFLDADSLRKWISNYQISDENTGKKVVVIMAGNIPMAGFHDMLCVLIAGHSLIGKLSSKDNKLLNFIARILTRLNPEFKSLITFSSGNLSDFRYFDAFIATGSNNSARYFEAYFYKNPRIIRKNRNSIAILNGNETPQELKNLGKDIFLYFGLGCRNVSKVYLPKGYDLKKLTEALKDHKGIIDHKKYANNYIYQKSLYSINKVSYTDTGFVLFKEDFGLMSPIGTVFYEFYSNVNILKQNIDEENVQCVVSNTSIFTETVHFGQTQNPNLWNYPDNIDIMNFLINFTAV